MFTLQPMRLRAFLQASEISETQFAELIGVKSRMTVHRYVRGQRVPNAKVMAKMEKVTKGLVGHRDFLEIGSEQKQYKLSNKMGICTGQTKENHVSSSHIAWKLSTQGAPSKQSIPNGLSVRLKRISEERLSFGRSIDVKSQSGFKNQQFYQKGMNRELLDIERAEILAESYGIGRDGERFKPLGRDNPVQLSLDLLGDRVEIKPTGYHLDGRPSVALQIVREANFERKRMGEFLLNYPGINALPQNI